MKNTILLLTLLFSVNALSAERAPAWWKDSTCKQTMNRDWLLLVADGYSRAEATRRTNENFKTCICSTGDESKSAVDSLLANYEIEMISENTGSIITVPIKYGRDFTIMWIGQSRECYINVHTTELCNNAGFMGEARQSYRVFETYDAKNNLCVTDVDNKFFKGE
ncbi:hypothetical protein M2399_002588 [Pseudomonas sp. BIGb0450]|uniref:hypothetical protein n=1 Tax=unclassified Pseudomonas TaxID=196821 RepID=UPI002168716F|nr:MULTISPECIES: hypothetical protein [unclassified Pseudomonas]MCS3417142.1 hypothetical protein [Pseudomonas sp. BIGb0558]MCS3437151.1 hypothetical protein [Pseudomonas sp. BIGb0450]